MTTRENIDVLEKYIPNLSEFFSDGEIGDYVETIDSDNEDDIIRGFLDNIWEDGFRRCDHCGKLMRAGYLLDNHYACSDECRNALYREWYNLYNDEDAEKVYYFDYWNASVDFSLDDWLLKSLKECQEYDGVESDYYFYTEWY